MILSGFCFPFKVGFLGVVCFQTQAINLAGLPGWPHLVGIGSDNCTLTTGMAQEENRNETVWQALRQRGSAGRGGGKWDPTMASWKKAALLLHPRGAGAAGP